MKNSLLLSSILLVACCCGSSCSSNGIDSSSLMDSVEQPKPSEAIPTEILDSDSNKSKVSNIESSNESHEVIEVTESKVTFNSDFEASISATIRNNGKMTIVALEIKFSPGGSDNVMCKPFVFQRKVDLHSGKSIQILQKIPKQEYCSYINGRVYINDCVFSDGTKKSGIY